MKTLVQGCETPAQFDLLIAMTRFTSKPKIAALRAYLVDGVPAQRCYARFGVSQQSFSLALLTLNMNASLAMDYVAARNSHARK